MGQGKLVGGLEGVSVCVRMVDWVVVGDFAGAGAGNW